MNETQQKVVAFAALIMLISVTAFLAACMIGIATAAITGDKGLGWLYLGIMRSADEIRTIFSIPIIIIASGITILGSKASKKWLVYLDSGIAIFGLVACLALLLMLLDQDGFAKPLWYYSDPEASPDQVSEGSTKLIGYIVAWLGAFLMTQLGIPKTVGSAAETQFSRFTKLLRKFGS